VLQTPKLMVLAISAMALAALPAGAQQPASSRPASLQGVGIDQRMDQQVPTDLTFRDENRQKCAASAIISARSRLSFHSYIFNCPFMCTEVLNGELRALQGISTYTRKRF